MVMYIRKEAVREQTLAEQSSKPEQRVAHNRAAYYLHLLADRLTEHGFSNILPGVTTLAEYEQVPGRRTNWLAARFEQYAEGRIDAEGVLAAEAATLLSSLNERVEQSEQTKLPIRRGNLQEVPPDTFGYHLRTVREYHQLTQGKLAEKSNYMRSEISEYEQNRTQPSLPRVAHLIQSAGARFTDPHILQIPRIYLQSLGQMQFTENQFAPVDIQREVSRIKILDSENTFGTYMRQLREDMQKKEDMYQYEFAKAMGISRDGLRELEAGIKLPSINTLFTWFQALRLSPESLALQTAWVLALDAGINRVNTKRKNE